jgi:NADPH2:quinone reductase
MRAVVVHAPGPPEALAVEEVVEPAAAAGEVVVDVRAAGVNFADMLIRRGAYPQPPPLPWIPGAEVAGVTAGGRRVLGLPPATGGGYAERVAVEERWLFELPAEASFEEGAAFPLAFLTAWLPLTRQARVQRGMRVLVHAAAGGVGTAAVQAASVLGAEVVATAGSEEKLALPLSLGASQGVTYDRLHEVEPVDVVLDPVGGSLFADSLPLLRPLGTAIAIGFAGGAWQPLDPALLVGRNVAAAGFYLGRLMRLEPATVHTAALDLLRLWEGGLLRPVVGATYPLERAPEAHRLLEERRSTGKVVLTT